MISNIEKNRRIEFGELYDEYFKRCDNCWSVHNISNLYYINPENNVMLCDICVDNIIFEHQTRRKLR